MKEGTNPLERVSVIISTLLAFKENDSKKTAGLALTDLSTGTGIPASVILEDLFSLFEYSFFRESLVISNAAGEPVTPGDLSALSGDIFVNIDTDMFRYGYADEQVAVMLSADERRILLHDSTSIENFLSSSEGGSFSSGTPVKIRLKIHDTSRNVIKKIRADAAERPDMVLSPSKDEESVWYCEDTITDKARFFSMLSEYGTSVVLVEPDSLIEDYTGLLKGLVKKLDGGRFFC